MTDSRQHGETWTGCLFGKRSFVIAECVCVCVVACSCTAALLNTQARGLRSAGSVQRDGGMQTDRGRLDGCVFICSGRAESACITPHSHPFTFFFSPPPSLIFSPLVIPLSSLGANTFLHHSRGLYNPI